MAKQNIGMGDSYTENLLFLGQVVRFARKSRKMSIRDLWFDSGVQIYQISNIENGKSAFRIKTFHRLFEAMEYPLEEAFYDYFMFSYSNE